MYFQINTILEIRKIEASSEKEIALVVKGASSSEWIIPCPSSQTAQWLRERIELAYTEYIKKQLSMDMN